MSSELIDQARADLDAGRTERARVALAEHVADHYDVDALDLLGEILHAEGDLPGAGAMWFATKRRGDDVVEAQNAWREHYHDDFGALWASLPPSVREDSPLPRVDALRRKAIETGGMPPADPASVLPARAEQVPAAESGAGATPEPADTADAPGGEPGGVVGADQEVAREPQHGPEQHEDDETSESAATPIPLPERRPGQQSTRERVVLRPVDLDEDDPLDTHRTATGHPETEPADEVHLVPADGDPTVEERGTTDEARPAPELKSGRPARALPKLSTGSLSGKIGNRTGGVDSATIIAGALAVLAVICMIVGLITILGWIIPG